MRGYNGFAVWAAVIAAAVIGGHLFSSKAPGGSLEPPAAPGGTMHSLDEIYANTAGVIVPPEALATARGPAYLYVDGVRGEVTESLHRDWIAIFGLAHDMELAISYGAGAPTAGRVQMAPFVVTKEWDEASPRLSLKCCNGQNINRIVAEWISNVDAGLVNLRVTLENVLVSRVSQRLVRRGDGFVLMEEVSFVFRKIKWEYRNDKGDMVIVQWDVVTNTGS